MNGIDGQHPLLETATKTIRTKGYVNAPETRRLLHAAENAKKQDKVTAITLLDLVERQQYRCAMTGVDLTPDTASLDHIVPIARGGENKLSNVHVVHTDVNRMKGAMELAEFIEWCGRVWNASNANGRS